ncbi:50S ribosomal protein L9 [Candidatus Nasuia deltocephalinicola]|nr:50S ribosomal protein L9 [Candidatus Nasuia deltocephalinicola]
MNVIFIEDYNLYKICDIINLSNGFCRNYLIPNFIVVYLDKKIYNMLDFFKKILILNDLKRKNFLKKIYIKYNNKKIFLKNFNYNLNNIFFKKYFLKKIGFFYYNYFIFFFKEIKKNTYIINIKIYNNIFIKFFILL